MVIPELETARLRLRPWRPDEAGRLREMWAERDPRVPAHRRISPDGHPTLAELEDRILRGMFALPAIEVVANHDVVGYCGLLDTGARTGDARPANAGACDAGACEPPMIAFELLRRAQKQGYALEAATAVVAWARAAGFTQLRATVWDWNTPSRRLLATLGFVETGRRDEHPAGGITLHTLLTL